MESIEFVKKPARVVCGPLQVVEEEDEEEEQTEERELDADDDTDALVERVIELAMDSSEEEEDEEQQRERLLDCDADVDTGQSQGRYSSEPQQTATHSSSARSSASAPSVVVDPEVNVVEVEAAFAVRLGYDRATNFVHLSDATDAFMSTVLVALQRHYNTRGPLRELLLTIFRQREERVWDDIPALQLWPEAGMHALKRASLAYKNKVASRLHYAYISRRDIVKLCVRHFVTFYKAVGAFEEAKVCSLNELKTYCKGL